LNKKKKTLPEKTVATWFNQICSAIQFMHENRMLHRDIKSANVFLDSNGNAKVGDLG
jgi:NIMA (never in mitosis gene a)-related kinase